VSTPKPHASDPAPFPASAAIDEQIAFLLRYAVLAPSSHNSQPWRFVVRANAVELRADAERWLRVADPERRELYVSLGCALENLLIAAEHYGFGHEIVFHADADRAGHAATVTLLAEGAPSCCRPAELYEAIVVRATNRSRYRRRAVPADALAQLGECAADTGVGLWLAQAPEQRARLLELVTRGDRALFRIPAWRRELGEWIGSGALGHSRLLARASQAAVSRLDLGASQARHDARVLRDTPVFGVLYSPRDDRESQIRVGQAFERLALLATNRGLAVQPLCQMIELPELRDELRRLLPDPAAFPQHPFRLGYARRSARVTPRRPASVATAG
jgi:nitroreductase